MEKESLDYVKSVKFNSSNLDSLPLKLEAEKIRDALSRKTAECNDFKARCGRFEILTVDPRGKDEVALDYEERIMRLKVEFDDRIRECEEHHKLKTKYENDLLQLARAQ